MRSFNNVATELLNVVSNEIVQNDIKNLIHCSSFRAPELMYLSWNELHEILVNEYDDPFTSNESMSVFIIFTGKSKDELLKLK